MVPGVAQEGRGALSALNTGSWPQSLAQREQVS